MKSVIVQSFLLLISTLVYSQSDRSKIIDILQTYKKINQEFINSVDRPDTALYYQLRSKVEYYSENIYDSILPEMVNHICKTKDQELLKIFFDVLISTQNSADDLPFWNLGEIYICQPDFTINMLNTNNEKKYLIEMLRFGFDQIAFKNKNSIGNYKALSEKLNTLKSN